jgi:hypothetical protein
VWTAALALRTPAAASTALRAAEAAAAGAASRLRAHCFLLPALRPGSVVQVQGLPDGVPAGPWLVLRAVHRLTATDGGSTAFEGVAAGTAGTAGGLLAAAAELAGSLL